VLTTGLVANDHHDLAALAGELLGVSSPTPLLAPVMTMTLPRIGCCGDAACLASEGEAFISRPSRRFL
jgi:hypothetical protein